MENIYSTDFLKDKKLTNQSSGEVLASHIIFAKSFYQRLIGLIGKKNFEMHKTLWIYPCRSVHTFFMSFSIDLIFVDHFLGVQAIYKNVKPWRCVPFIRGGCSVFEFQSGVLNEKKLKKGDQLSVVS